MSSLYLMRHGHIDNPNGVFYDQHVALSDRGHREIENLCHDMVLHHARPTRIVCSPFLRTTQTAEIAAEIFNIDHIETDKRLQEWNVNDWYGKPLKEFEAYVGYRQPHILVNELPDIESFDHLAHRCRTALEDIAKTSHSPTLVISHREPMVCAMLALSNQPWEHVPLFDMPPASVWELKWTNEKLHVIGKIFDRSNND